MLILSRREGESIMIGDSIEVCISRIEHETVKIGIIAPKEMPIFRDEVYRKIRDSNLGAARTGPAVLPRIRIAPTPAPGTSLAPPSVATEHPVKNTLPVGD
jgi:carbon storage regulator